MSSHKNILKKIAGIILLIIGGFGLIVIVTTAYDTALMFQSDNPLLKYGKSASIEKKIGYSFGIFIWAVLDFLILWLGFKLSFSKKRNENQEQIISGSKLEPDKKRTCAYCKSNNVTDANFCRNCGKKLETSY